MEHIRERPHLSQIFQNHPHVAQNIRSAHRQREHVVEAGFLSAGFCRADTGVPPPLDRLPAPVRHAGEDRAVQRNLPEDLSGGDAKRLSLAIEQLDTTGKATAEVSNLHRRPLGPMSWWIDKPSDG